MFAKVKRIELYAGTKKPKITDVFVNPSYVRLIAEQDAAALRLNGWCLPADNVPIYKASIDGEEDVLTDEDGFLNLTKGNK